MTKKSTKKIKSSKVDILVERLKKDVAARALRPGDRYFMAYEIKDMYNVSTVTAHRALSKMAEEGILIRMKKSGTFVGEKAADLEEPDTIRPMLRVVHVFMPLSYNYLTEIKDTAFVETVGRYSPGTAVQIHYVPEDDPANYIRRILPQINRNRDSEGLILIRSSEDVQRYIESEDVNAVIFGSVYAGVKNLPSLDVDQRQTGRLMVEAAVKSGFKKFVLLMYNRWRSGDNLLFDEVLNTLGKAGVDMRDFRQKTLPTIKSIVRAEAHRTIKEASEPVMFLCRSDYFADIVIDTAEEENLRYGKDFGVVSGGHFRSSPERKYPCVTPQMTIEEQLTKIVEMLKNRCQRDKTVKSFTVEAELQKPDIR